MSHESTGARVALSTAGSEEQALELARHLVESGLVACVNVVPGVQSIYRWQGEVCHDREWLLVIKTMAHRVEQLETRLREMHDYDNPELVVLEVTAGSAPYLSWLEEQVQG